METRKYISMVKKVLKSVDLALGTEVTSEECDDLFWDLSTLSTEIFKLTNDEYLKLKKYLTTKIENLKTENTLESQKELHLLKTSLGYLEFYTHCQLEKSNYSLEEGYNNSQWSTLFTDNKDWNEKQKENFTYIVARLELSYFYDKVSKECGTGLYLNAYEVSEITDMIPTIPESRIAMFGLVSSREYRNRNPYGRYFNYEDRTEEYYLDLLKNCDNTIELYKTIIEKLLELAKKDSFKGIFDEYDKNNITKFVDLKVKSLTKSLNSIENTRTEVQDEYNKKFGIDVGVGV